MNTIAQLLDPALLILAAGLPFGVGAIIFALYRRGPGVSIFPGAPLSWAEPVEIRLVLYLLFAAIFGVVAFVPRILYLAAPDDSAAAGILLTLAVLAFVLDLAFVYASAGTLLHAALGTRGRPTFWFSRVLAPLDSAVMGIGDGMARLLLRTGTTASRPAPARALDFESERLDLEPDEESPVAAPPRQQRANRRDPYAVARERLNLILSDYESRLTPAQQERYLLMKEIVSYLMEHEGALV
jgi:hypothetical protein